MQKENSEIIPLVRPRNGKLNCCGGCCFEPQNTIRYQNEIECRTCGFMRNQLHLSTDLEGVRIWYKTWISTSIVSKDSEGTIWFPSSLLQSSEVPQDHCWSMCSLCCHILTLSHTHIYLLFQPYLGTHLTYKQTYLHTTVCVIQVGFSFFFATFCWSFPTFEQIHSC